MFSTLISVSDLAARPDHSDWLIVDCRFDLTNPTAGENAYRDAHIPSAIYAHLDRDLSAPRTSLTGRHPLPTAEQFAGTLSSWGIGAATQVIAYDADNGAYAARLWWMLRWVGHRAVAVLDGGYKAWCAAQLPVTKDIVQRRAMTFTPHPDRTMWLNATEVAEQVQRADWRLLDARAVERFAGEIEPLDPVAGHVPGARNHPFASSLDSHGKFLAPEVLRARFEASQRGVVDSHTVLMCGSGVTACHALLAMEVAGKRGARLYPGSWSEWITDASRPVAQGRDA